MRTLAITQNVTVDGSVEMLGDWFDPQGQAGVDNSDLLDELHRQDQAADGFLVGRQTFEDLRSYWPQQADDATGVAFSRRASCGLVTIEPFEADPYAVCLRRWLAHPSSAAWRISTGRCSFYRPTPRPT